MNQQQHQQQQHSTSAATPTRMRKRRQILVRDRSSSPSRRITTMIMMTKMMMLLLLLLLGMVCNNVNVVHAAIPSTGGGSSNATYDNVNVLIEQAPIGYTIIFPWFIQIMGVIIFFILTRYESIAFIPFQSIMFIIGAICGYCSTIRYNTILQNNSISEMTSEDSYIYNTLYLSDELDQLSISVLQWSTIDSVILLLVFLPGLIFRDAIEAFPLVLVGAAMITAVGKYILHEYLPQPSNDSSSSSSSYDFYNWPISLWMVLGAILSSTDPIAVGSLLKKAKAPPRLQMHISGESLINDGSALVFYVIFTKQYIADLGYADHVTVTEGILLFLRMALGGLTVGTCFAFGLCYVLHIMDSRLEPEYNIIQVVAALSIAYISYYVAEQVCNMSGIIACVSCGILTRAIGKGLIREHHLMDSYLALMEHLLNTLLFALGGVVWGKAVADGKFAILDWFHLIVFYIFVTIIRFVQVAMFYPIISRIGLKSDWKEAIFLAYGGIRGSVGIAFAIALKGQVLPLTESTETKRELTLLEFYAGGITLLTLLINASTAGPMLRKLGLTKPVVSRKQAIKLFESSAKSFINAEYNILRSQARFAQTRFQIIKAHVPYIIKPSSRSLLTDRKQSKSSRYNMNNNNKIPESQRTFHSYSDDHTSTNGGQHQNVPSFLYNKKRGTTTTLSSRNSRQLSTPLFTSDFFSTTSFSNDDHHNNDNNTHAPTEINVVKSKPTSMPNTHSTVEDNHPLDDPLHTHSDHSTGRNRSTRSRKNTRQKSTPLFGSDFFSTTTTGSHNDHQTTAEIDAIGKPTSSTAIDDNTHHSDDQMQTQSNHSSSQNVSTRSRRNTRQKSTPLIGGTFFTTSRQDIEDNDRMTRVIENLNSRNHNHTTLTGPDSHRTINTNISSDRLPPHTEQSSSHNIDDSVSTRSSRVRQKSAPSYGSNFFMKRDDDENIKNNNIDTQSGDDHDVPTIEQQNTDTIEPAPTYETNDDDEMRHSHHLSRMLTVRSLGSEEQIVELRHFFLDLLDQAYCDELELGEIDEGQENEGLNADILRESVALARRWVDNDQPMQDWEFAKYNKDHVVDLSVSHWLEYLFISKEDRIRAMNYQHRRNNVLRTLAFIEAHERAEEKLKALLSSTSARTMAGHATALNIPPDIVENQTDDDKQIVDVDGDDPERTQSVRSNTGGGSLDAAIARVLTESKQQVKMARRELTTIPKPEIQRITSHYLCTILLHKLIDFVGESIVDGLISRKEGMLYFRQIDRSLQQSYTCTHDHLVETEDINPSLLERIDHHQQQHNSIRSIGSANKGTTTTTAATLGGTAAVTSNAGPSTAVQPEKLAAARVTAVMDAYFHNFKK